MEPSHPAPDPAGLRRSYGRATLDEATAARDPLDQFTAWYADAVAAGLPEPNAMVLATASADGRPSARTVLLKGYDARGFRFFTNYDSLKARDLAANPRACLVFPWYAMEREVRISGEVTRLPRDESDAYFHSRPRGSQLGAWASAQQSAVVSSRRVLEERFAELARRWPEGTQVPLPDFWGGFLVAPTEYEFWQGRPDRLHDRLRYRRKDVPDTEGGTAGRQTAGWEIERLSP